MTIRIWQVALLMGLASSYSKCLDPSEFPVVDLGYVKHRALTFNPSGEFFHFSNIRFARAPLGNLRFRRPEPPGMEDNIQDGNYTESACVQTWPVGYVPDYPILDNVTFGTEDCLLLDVYVPSVVKPNDSVPVLSWWYGGAFTTGNKGGVGGSFGSFDVSTLLRPSDEPFIVVSANYRLGAFGWLAPTDEDVDANVGLHDVRAAMEWIKRYIPLFGGDPHRITAMGVSSGAGLIMHTMTAYGGQKCTPPFQSAILQSPGFISSDNRTEVRNSLYQDFARLANCTNIKCLRSASTDSLKQANKDLIWVRKQDELHIGPNFAPMVDNEYVPDYPGKLLLNGRFHHSVKTVFSSNTANEGGYFVPPNVSDGYFDRLVRLAVPSASPASIAEIDFIYQATNSTEYLRSTKFIGDAMINCNAQVVAQAFSHSGYRYIFDIPPAVHSTDLSYTFYAGPNLDPAIVSDKAAIKHQQYIKNYVLHGNPNGKDDCEGQFLRYGSNGEALRLTLDGVRTEKDPWKGPTCETLRSILWELQENS